jgi:hypothetical protein
VIAKAALRVINKLYKEAIELLIELSTKNAKGSKNFNQTKLQVIHFLNASLEVQLGALEEFAKGYA